jgi:hypothetical protein
MIGTIGTAIKLFGVGKSLGVWRDRAGLARHAVGVWHYKVDQRGYRRAGRHCGRGCDRDRGRNRNAQGLARLSRAQWPLDPERGKMPMTRLIVVGAVALTLAGGASRGPASVAGGECKIFERPEYESVARRRMTDWISNQVEGGAAVANGSGRRRGDRHRQAQLVAPGACSADRRRSRRDRGRGAAVEIRAAHGCLPPAGKPGGLNLQPGESPSRCPRGRLFRLSGPNAVARDALFQPLRNPK